MCYADAHKPTEYTIIEEGGFYTLLANNYPLYRGLTLEGCETLIRLYREGRVA